MSPDVPRRSRPTNSQRVRTFLNSSGVQTANGATGAASRVEQQRQATRYVEPNVFPGLDWLGAQISGNVTLPADTITTVLSLDLYPGWWLINAGVLIRGDASTDAPAMARLNSDAGTVGSFFGGQLGAEQLVHAGALSQHRLAPFALTGLLNVFADGPVILECKPYGVDMQAPVSDYSGLVSGANILAINLGTPV